MRNALVRHVFAVAVAVVGIARLAGAQQPADADLRRVVQAFRTAAPAATLGAVNAIPASRLTLRDRSIAEMFRGFALHRLRRQADAEVALQRAASLDPTVIPEADVVGQDFVDVYRVARARIPVVATFSLTPLEFIPQLDSTTRLTYQMEGGRILRRGRAQLRLMLVRKGTADSSVLWRGAEADSNVVWNGMVNGKLVEPGDYDYVLEARGTDIPIPTQRRRPVRIQHFAIDSSRMLRLPGAPLALPESSVFKVEDRERKSAVAKRGLVVSGIGAIMAIGAAVFVQTAIDRSPPKSGLRYAVAGTYVAGLTTVAIGGVLALRSRSARFRSEVAFPNNENIRLNRELRLEYAAEVERVNKYNDLLRRATVIRQTFLDGAER